MKTLLANLKFAARNGQYVHIGGGRFTPSEISKAVAQIEKAIAYLKESQQAWEGEEDSVREEHEVLIVGISDFLEKLRC